jgi:transcriptional regulator with XRE-family HTH domain
MPFGEKMTFGEFVRQKRLEAGLSQDEVARALGYKHRSNIHRLETGKLEWKLTAIIKLAALFGMSAVELLAEFNGK